MDDVFLGLQSALAGEYSIERELGRGGMGIVYLAGEVPLTRIPKLGNAQITFFASNWSERFFKLAGLGVKKTSSASTLPQLTEVALGRATDALYDARPKSLREGINRLDASIGDLDGDARAAIPSAIVDSPHEARIRMRRDQLRSDLRVTRERAGDRLAATVAALENIRLDLLRLELGAFADARHELDELLGDHPTPPPLAHA